MFNSQSQPTPGNGDGQLDVSSIGRTNGLHSEEEQLFIRNVLLAAESILQSGTVDGDLRRREEAVDLIGRCKIALAPHKRLPPDILRSMFRFCAEECVQFPLGSKCGGMDQNLCLLRITHVCSAWRHLALETPALWSDIYIFLLGGDGKQHDKTLSSARQWFDRAQDMRRSLFIIFLEILHDSWEKLLEFMAQYRLEELELVYFVNRVAKLKFPDAWPPIEHSHLDGLSAGEQLFSNFGNLSNLRHLKIIGSYYLDGMDRIIPWHQLRTFEVGGLWGCPVTPSWCLNMLRQSRLLEHCRITLSIKSSFKSTVISTEESIVLTNIDYFEAEFLDASGLAVSKFLQPLAMPNITTFTLRGDELSCDTLALIGIIQRSGGMCRIRHLEIQSYTFTVLDVGVLLELLPSLDSIRMTSGHLSDNSIKRLSTGKLGPRLCKIVLFYRHDADQILSMESRYQNATQQPPGSDDTPCPFKSISIPCTTMLRKSSCHDRIALLSEKCDADINLSIGEDSEDERGYEEQGSSDGDS